MTSCRHRASCVRFGTTLDVLLPPYLLPRLEHPTGLFTFEQTLFASSS